MGKVVNVALQTGVIDQVIAVDDGSSDESSKELGLIKDQRFLLITHPKNQGKTAAIKTGLKQCSSEDLVLFLDADLQNLTTGHIMSLLNPVMQGKADHTYSGREKLPFLNVLSGDRVIKLNQWQDFFKNKRVSGYGLEMMMNRFAMKHNLKTLQVRWTDVSQTYKAEKKGGAMQGLWAELKAVLNIMRSTGMIQFFWIHGTFWWKTKRYELFESKTRA